MKAEMNWYVQSPHPEYSIGVRTKDGLLIAAIRYSDNPRITKEQAEYHAQLISAAPELLIAAKQALSALNHIDRGWVVTIANLKAAIIKAQGNDHD